ncbi:hypothetical protein HID58_041774 [Brassica napus]|uniref:(rape) hypothetical protein n=1 Tax=Brassica napus TaxID=3708 RepID=A0A816REZ6_BRANA|nr:hypothetical protein HID58_041774 [Brassica napus]CAF2071723.1 unnamed protein product [Brassica napus]
MKNLIHLVLHAIALALGIWGIYAVSKNHYKSGIPDLIASIPGLCVYSFIVFFFPGGSPNLRSGLLPCHVMLGLFVYIHVVGNAALGLLEKLTILESGGLEKYGTEAFVVLTLQENVRVTTIIYNYKCVVVN